MRLNFLSVGSYLALTAPKVRDTITRFWGGSEPGNIYILDLGKIDRETGRLDSSALTVIKGSDFPNGRGKQPQYVTSGNANGEFLLSNAKDYNDGVIAITVGTNENGNLDQKFKLSKPEGLSPRTAERPDQNYLSRRMQQNIQRSAGNVVVNVDGVEYALVADYYFPFNGAFWDSDSFYGLGKQEGGKIGVIEDPFGKNGKPRYLGATTPIVGGSIDHVSLSAGKLYADVWIDEATEFGSRMYKSLFVWDAPGLVKAAREAKNNPGFLKSSIPIDRVSTSDRDQIPYAKPSRYDGAVNNDNKFGWIYGIGAYSVPGRGTFLSASDSAYPKIEYRYTGNVYREALGITDRDYDQILQGNGNIYAYTAKTLFYNGWNFVTGGFVGRQSDRYAALTNGDISSSQYWNATGIDGVTTVAAIGAAGIAGSRVAGAAGSGFFGEFASSAAGGVTYSLVQQAGEVATYNFTQDARQRIPSLGKSLDQATTDFISASNLTQLSSDVVLDAGLGWLMGWIGGRSNMRAMHNSPNQLNPTKIKVAEPQLAADPFSLRGSQADSSGGRIISAAGGEIVTYSGRTLSIPNRISNTVSEALDWMEAQGRRLGDFVNSTASAMDRAWQAVQMQQNILLAARNSLKDGNALAQLNVFHPIRTFNELKAELGKRFSGQKLYEKIVEAAEANCKRESIGCFVAGTLVHTKDGLKPIQDIQVGDYVLSRPESGEEGVTYKRVVNTFRFENKPVSYVEYVTFESKNDVVERSGADYLIATPNHPFWVVGKTMIEGSKQVCDYYALPLWKSVDQLDYEEIVVLSNGQQVKITGVGAIKKTKQNGTGWHQAQYAESPWEDDGHLVNFSPENVTAELTFMSRAVFNEDAPRDKFEDYVDYESVVYNLEVEDFHTYFVGKMGVWVHNTNCGGSDASGTQNLTQEVIDG